MPILLSSPTCSSFLPSIIVAITGPRMVQAQIRMKGTIYCKLGENDTGDSTKRREIIFQSTSMAMLAAIFNFSGARPNFLGVQQNPPPSLALCPPTPDCVSTSEELDDPARYIPPWTYNPEDGRGRKKPVTQETAMSELIDVVTSTKPDNFTAKILKKTDDYLYVEYESPIFGFVDDVEFWFPPGKRSLVEYRSASRLGRFGFENNRKRIKVLRQELERKGWQSVGF